MSLMLRAEGLEGEGLKLTLKKVKPQVKRAVHSTLDNHVDSPRERLNTYFMFT